MSKVSRADWAPPTRWNDIPDKPTIIGERGPAGPAGPTGPTGPAGSAGLPAQITLTWDIPTLAPLQTATQEFNVAGVFPGNPLAFGWTPNPGFMWFWGLVTDIQVITLYAKNMDASPITFGEVTATVQRFS